MLLRLLSILLINLTFISSSYALSIDDSRHLLSRTGFAPSFTEVQAYKNLSRQEAVQKRIRELNRPYEELDLPYEFSLPYEIPFDAKKASKKERQAFRKEMRQQTNELKGHLIKKMIQSNNPFQENLTLFWHNHFVSSSRKVKHPALMAHQNQTLRQYSSANFGDFLHAMLKDPALIRYLDNQKNRKGKANENLARELFELFTLGEGHYTEQDIKEAARALSGYSIKHKTGEFRFLNKQHDNGRKTIFKKTGNWDADDLVELILKQKQTARFITEKLWSHIVTTPIPHPVLNRLSRDFYENYEIKPLLQAILQQPQFWAANNRGTKIKDPINLVVGLYRQFELKPKSLKPLIQSSASMGQNLLMPPNVKGWNTGTGWINTTTLLARQNVMAKATRGMMIKRKVNGNNKKQQEWLDILLAKNLQQDVPTANDNWQQVNSVLNHINYQLE